MNVTVLFFKLLTPPQAQQLTLVTPDQDLGI
jgi:hypothetical protein